MLTVTAAILVERGRILCAQRSASMKLPLKWEFPGGKLEEGETPEACIRREIREELGVDIEIVEQLDPVFFPKDEPTLKLLPFLAQIPDGFPSAVEHAQIKWVPILDMVVLDWAEADIELVEWCQHNKRQLFGYE